MNDELTKLLNRPLRIVDETDDDHDENDRKAFGQLGANSRGSVMLDLRFKTGDRRALPYAYLVELDLDKSGKVVLGFVGHKVTIVGRHVDRLYAALSEHRVRYIREGEFGYEKPGETFIESIRVETLA